MNPYNILYKSKVLIVDSVINFSLCVVFSDVDEGERYEQCITIYQMDDKVGLCQ